MICVIDNYDSFVYNLVQYLGELGEETVVFRNDKITLNEIKKRNPEGILLSPGPCAPEKAGICVDLVGNLGQTIPILGVCLGHQAIAAAFGGKIIRAPKVCHGKTSQIYHYGNGLYQGIPNPFAAARYHSLIAEEESLPDCLEINARTKEGMIMGIKHKEYNIAGVQFHPESILTENGRQLLKNFFTR